MAKPNTDRTRAIVLTTQRTGSGFLIGCLASHPQIESADEILSGDPDVPEEVPAPEYRGPFKKVHKLARLIRAGAWRPGHRMDRFYGGGTAPVRIFKAMYNDLVNPFALRYLQRNDDIRVIHLRRDNLLKVYVSRQLMARRDKLHVHEPVEAIRTHVDPAAALAYIRKARAQYDRFEHLFAGHARLPVVYEEMIAGQHLSDGTNADICRFLGVASFRMKTRQVKLNPESLQDMVTNYDEVAAAISQSEFARMLN